MSVDRWNTVLVLGGIRSGKSAFAESLVADAASVRYVATAVGGEDDPEWMNRIEAHQRRRPAVVDHRGDRRGSGRLAGGAGRGQAGRHAAGRRPGRLDRGAAGPGAPAATTTSHGRRARRRGAGVRGPGGAGQPGGGPVAGAGARRWGGRSPTRSAPRTRRWPRPATGSPWSWPARPTWLKDEPAPAPAAGARTAVDRTSDTRAGRRNRSPTRPSSRAAVPAVRHRPSGPAPEPQPVPASRRPRRASVDPASSSSRAWICRCRTATPARRRRDRLATLDLPGAGLGALAGGGRVRRRHPGHAPCRQPWTGVRVLLLSGGHAGGAAAGADPADAERRIAQLEAGAGPLARLAGAAGADIAVLRVPESGADGGRPGAGARTRSRPRCGRAGSSPTGPRPDGRDALVLARCGVGTDAAADRGRWPRPPARSRSRVPAAGPRAGGCYDDDAWMVRCARGPGRPAPHPARAPRREGHPAEIGGADLAVATGVLLGADGPPDAGAAGRAGRHRRRRWSRGTWPVRPGTGACWPTPGTLALVRQGADVLGLTPCSTSAWTSARARTRWPPCRCCERRDRRWPGPPTVPRTCIGPSLTSRRRRRRDVHRRDPARRSATLTVLPVRAGRVDRGRRRGRHEPRAAGVGALLGAVLAAAPGRPDRRRRTRAWSRPRSPSPPARC